MWNPGDLIWGAPSWPVWMTGFREHQKDAIAECVMHYENGADIVILNAPTGAGKTVIAEAVRRLVDPKHTLYVANTKGLQDQFAADFSYAAMLKGRSNYATADHPELFDAPYHKRVTAADCAKTRTELPACDTCTDVTANATSHCLHCHPVAACPYEQAKMAAITADLAITNTAYFVTEANGPGMFSRPDQLVVIDECDTLESILMSHAEVFMSSKMRQQYKIDAPKVKGKDAKSNDWMSWCEDHALPTIMAEYNAIVRNHKHTMRTKNGEYTVWNNDVPPKALREGKALEQMYGKLKLLRDDLVRDNAVYDGWNDGAVRFKPIRVDWYGEHLVWRHAPKFLLMSATVIDPVEYTQSLGIEDAGLRWELVNVPSTFPPENRPIHVKPVANMRRAETETAWPQMADAITRVLDHHPNDRTLVHTVSYKLAEYLLERVDKHCNRQGEFRELYTYKNAREREDVLEEFRKTDAAVLFAPSMDRGVDLPEDDCRVVIVAKIPFPNLGDKQVHARMYSKGGKLWYAVQTVRSLVQMTGRGVRSASDRCDIYVLDKQFMANVWANNKRLLPEWWTEAIDWSGGGV